MALVKCQICLNKDDKQLMVQESNKKYYHLENCHSVHLEIQRKKKQISCEWCKEKDDPERLIVLQIEGIRRDDKSDNNGALLHKKGDLFFTEIKIHSKCKDAFEEDKIFKKKEFEEKKKLSIKIAEIYRLEHYLDIPESFYPYIEDLRNDSALFGRMGKNYKQGIPYSGIAYTYEYCKNKIMNARDYINQRDGGFKNCLAELKYGLKIIRDNLADAKEHSIRQHNQKLEKEKMIRQTEVRDMSVEVESNYKKKSKGDISSLL